MDTSARYVYYGCTRARNINCKSGYIREEDLIEQLVKIMDKLDLNEMHMRHKFEEEVARINKFQKSFFGGEGRGKIQGQAHRPQGLRDLPPAGGTTVEKREFMSCIRSKFLFKNKTITLEK